LQRNRGAEGLENLNYFESCLPSRKSPRGRDTLAWPDEARGLKISHRQNSYAAVQLRQENLRADSYNLSDFRTT